MNAKNTSHAFVLLILMLVNAAEAKDFGVIGRTWEIKERNAVEVIKDKLTHMEKTGALEQHNNIVKERIENNIRKPRSLNIPAATVERIFEYDPSIVVKEDLRDARGIIFHKKGTIINPLDTVSMPYQMVFFDAENKKQLEYALEIFNSSEIKPKLILTGGSPINIEKEYGLDVYFDQRGVLIKQLGIQAVPAVVEQSGKVLQIKEVKLDL